VHTSSHRSQLQNTRACRTCARRDGCPGGVQFSLVLALRAVLQHDWWRWGPESARVQATAKDTSEQHTARPGAGQLRPPPHSFRPAMSPQGSGLNKTDEQTEDGGRVPDFMSHHTALKKPRSHEVPDALAGPRLPRHHRADCSLLLRRARPESFADPRRWTKSGFGRCNNGGSRSH